LIRIDENNLLNIQGKQNILREERKEKYKMLTKKNFFEDFLL
jgi:hypothetical protein